MPQDLEEKLLGQALRYIGYRSRSRHEITTYITRKAGKHITPDVIDSVLSKLKQFDLIDDQAFAQAWVESAARKYKGPRRIHYELKNKRVPLAIITQQINSISPKTWKDKAASALNRKARLWTSTPPQKFKQKAYQYLFSRGYQSQTIQRVIDAILKTR